MTNIDRAAQVIDTWIREHTLTPDTGNPKDLARALADAGLLAPDVQVIRTLEDIKALDPDTLVGTHSEIASTTFGAGHILATAYLGDLTFPMVVVATGAQTRAAREALEEENER